MYALWGSNSSTWITYKGKVLVHDSREELEFLFPGQRVVPADVPPAERLSIKQHPQMHAVKWPLERKDFW